MRLLALIRRSVFSHVSMSSVFIASLIAVAPLAAMIAEAAVTAAAGGTNISADNAANATSPAYTTLGDIVMTESAATDIPDSQLNETLILTAPSGWEFNAGTGSATASSLGDLTIDSTVVTPSTITVTFSSDSNADETDTITISGIQVRATEGAAITSAGDILRTSGNPGSAVINNIITNDSTNFGSLSQAVGTMSKLVVTLPGQTFADGSTVAASGNTGSATAQTVGTQFEIVSLIATDQFFNIVTSYSGAKTISYSGPGTSSGGAPSYTTAVSFTNGQSTTILNTTLRVAESATITATQGVSGPASSGLTVDQKTVTPSIAANNKTYDGSTVASLSSQTVSGVLSGDTVTLSVTAADFDTADVGVGKTVTATGLSLGGTDAGNYVLSSTSATTTADITKASQTITFNALSGKIYGDADFGVSATADSGLPVTFTSQTTGVCTVSASTVHIVSAGTCTIRASQAGDTNYLAASNVDQGFTVLQAVTVTLSSSDKNPAMDTETITFTAVVTGVLPTGTVLFKDNGSTIGSGTISSTGATIFQTTLSGNGATHPITAEYQGDLNNVSSISNTISQVVNTLPKLTVTKVVVNDNGGTKTITDFTFKIDSVTVTSGVQNTSTVGVHTVNEVADSGYAATISGDCATDGTITLALNDVKACTITNNDIQPKLTFTTVVTNDNGGTKVVADFPLKVGTVSITSGTQSGFNVGTYVLTESGSLGYVATFSGDCDSSGNLTLALGEVKTCTITNDDIAPKITVTKVLVTDNGGTQIITDFPLFVDSTSVTSAGQITTTVGLHTISETTIPSQYTSIVTGDCASNGTITLVVGDVKSCVITNDDKPAHLIVIKQVTNDNGGTKVPSNFTMNMTANSPSQTSFAGADTPGIDITLNAGSYAVSEAADSGYAVSYSSDCTGSMLPGDTKTCTITNNDIQPKLTVTKIVINDNGGTKVVSDFPLFVGSTSVVSGDQNGFNAASYVISETGMPTTYAMTITGDCDGSGNITLLPGEVKSCTITNNDIAPTLTVIKEVINENGGTKTATGFTLKIDDIIVTTGALNTLNVGDYTVSELLDPKYDSYFRGACFITNGVINLQLGENKTCIIKNFDIPEPPVDESNTKVNAGHSGHGVGRLIAIAKHVVGSSGLPPGAFGGGESGPINEEEKKLICSMQRTDRYGDDSKTEFIGTLFATLLGRPDPAPVIAALKDPAFCVSASQAAAPTKEPLAVRINKDGFVLSSNPVWNACIRGKATLGLIKSNKDTVVSRQGKIVTLRPKSCDDYHTNSFSIWKHPDFDGLEITLDTKGHLVGSVPNGYVAVRDTATVAKAKSVSQTRKKPSVAAK